MLIFYRRQHTDAGAELLARFGSARQTGPAGPASGPVATRRCFSGLASARQSHSTNAPGDNEPAVLALSSLRGSAEQLPQRPCEVPQRGPAA
jgi:hypothetical protein